MTHWFEADHFREFDVLFPVDLIPTTTVTIIQALLTELLVSGQRRHVFALVGVPGSGKTVACRTFIHDYQCRESHERVAFSYYQMDEPSSLPSLPEDMLRRPCGSYCQDDAQQMAHSRQTPTTVHVTILDMGQAVHAPAFAALREHHQTCTCHIVVLMRPDALAALPEGIVESIVHLPDLTLQECVTSILPRIQLSHWQFDVGDEYDQELGVWMFQRLLPLGVSFRKILFWLAFANECVDLYGLLLVTDEILDDVLLFCMVPMRMWSTYGTDTG